MSRTPCRFFNTPSGCGKGSQCPFVHSSPNDTTRSPTFDNVAPPHIATSRTPCRFFNTPSGCGKGSQCPFVHSSPNDTTRSPTFDDVAPPQSAYRPSGNGNPPPGVCKHFWDTGRCKWEFNCRYKHTQQAGNTTPSPATSPSTTAQSTSESVSKRVAPFLTEQGLSKMSGSGTDGFFAQDDSLSPSEAHNTLKKRNKLYEGLQDHELVQKYDDVRGMVKNLFFVTHNHKENGGTDDTTSKYNVYEVEMIRDLVLYLLRQGCYSAEGDIVVLCAYLGQLARLRDALAGEVTVVIDERDQAALDDREADQDDTGDAILTTSIQRVKVKSHVRLRMVDNYQGEEGKIVILSLVRNSGGGDDELEIPTISQHTLVNVGFLKAENRTNVALSRTREGLYIFGNAENLSAKSRMWRSIIEELDAHDSVGPALPVACHRHPDKIEYVSSPGQLSWIAPDGGCLEQCDQKLKCGHPCPFKCHCDDPDHVAVMCTQRCRKLCRREHRCKEQCHTPCGDCLFPVTVLGVELPCGHVKDSVPCYRYDALENARCDEEVEKPLPDCEHWAKMPCSQDPKDYRCQVRCGELMACCGKSCNASCDECQSLNDTLTNGGAIKRTKHTLHPCQKRLYCEHTCQGACSESHEHTTRCKANCRQVCPHSRCRNQCSVPCAPCKQPCTWSCTHYSCPVPCGSVCVRPPCDRRCEKILGCGHQCPSVCGEDCAIQVCPKCASEKQKAQIADFVMQRTLAEVDPDSESLEELVITIPSCRHTFTVEMLDGHCSMSEFYSTVPGPNGEWRGLLTPIGFRRPPTCPTCRADITAPRYGRVFKRAALDILERNVAAQMSLSLGTVQKSLESVPVHSKKDQLVNVAATIDLKFKDKTDEKKRVAQEKARRKALNSQNEMPIPERDINPASKQLHAIDGSVLDAWRKTMHELLTAYKQAVHVAETRSAHTEAWEAAFAYLREHEVDAALGDLDTSSRDPMNHAMLVAKTKIGQPRPLADRRLLVEAIWLTLHIRLILTDMTTAWMDAITKRTGNGVNTPQQLAWATYIGFLFQSCSRDAGVAFDVAKDSESHRQISKTALYQMRISLEEFRFDMMMCKLTDQFKEQEHRNTLAERASSLKAEVEASMNTTIREYRAKKTGIEAAAWLETNFSSVARDIVDEWETIERSIRMDTFYQPISLQERIAIVEALNFSHAGHFYICPNGHMFIMTECGGAVEVARCPECDAVVGGSLAMQARAAPSPW
ncbi:AAA domain containing protein [Tylopilus felleus]